MEIAGDRPPRYGGKTVIERSRGTGPRATVLHRDQEVSPTDKPIIYQKTGFVQEKNARAVFFKFDKILKNCHNKNTYYHLNL